MVLIVASLILPIVTINSSYAVTASDIALGTGSYVAFCYALKARILEAPVTSTGRGTPMVVSTELLADLYAKALDYLKLGAWALVAAAAAAFVSLVKKEVGYVAGAAALASVALTWMGVDAARELVAKTAVPGLTGGGAPALGAAAYLAAASGILLIIGAWRS